MNPAGRHSRAYSRDDDDYAESDPLLPRINDANADINDALVQAQVNRDIYTQVTDMKRQHIKTPRIFPTSYVSMLHGDVTVIRVDGIKLLKDKRFLISFCEDPRRGQEPVLQQVLLNAGKNKSQAWVHFCRMKSLISQCCQESEDAFDYVKSKDTVCCNCNCSLM